MTTRTSTCRAYSCSKRFSTGSSAQQCEQMGSVT